MAEWYEDWFNTEEYLNVYRHRNEEDAKKLVKLILRNVDLNPGAKVLDMACGAGRHSILFAQEGFHVTAVDLSENLLKVAKCAAEDSGVKVDFVESDLRYYSVSTKFGLIINLFTSFGYFESDEENFVLFNVAYNQLMENGYFVFDYFNPRYIKNNLVPETEEDLGISKVVQQRKIEGNRVVKKITINKNGSEKHYHESVRMYEINELKSEFEKTGFTIQKIFGDFHGKEFDLETSPRIIIIARK